MKFKSLTTSVLTTALLFGLPATPICAQQINTSGETASPNWWPGDPNPQPGSEAWLQQNANVRASDMTTARKCALEALIGSGIGSSSDAFISWLGRGVWSVGSFAQSFGVSWVVSYFYCITANA